MKILFLTVGTGVGTSEEKTKSLAHGLLYSILSHTPDKIIFFGSQESLKTVEEVKRQYFEKKREKLNEDRYEFVKIDNIDDFYDCYSKIEDKIKEYRNHEIVVDYTSGTKTMTTSAAIAAMLYQKKLFVISGKRGKNGLILPGTEEIKEQNLFAAYDKYALDKAKESFNSYRYEDARNYLMQIVASKEKDDYINIVNAYDLWDKFNHEKAWESMDGIKKDFLSKNKSFLGRLYEKIKKEGRRKEGEKKAKHLDPDLLEFFIPDLLNNAMRRMEEGKYDDAVARLYRCVEMLCQYRLIKKYGINPSDVDTWRLKADLGMEKELVEKYEKGEDEKGKVKLALNGDMELLKDLGDEIGKWKDDKFLKDLLSKRNSSILAHGIEPIDKETAEKFYRKVLEIAKSVLKDVEEKMEIARFPKL